MLDAQPDSPALLTDLATAYFQRAVATDRAIDYGQTIELLGRTLAKTPDDPVALFNRAIALQKMFAYNEAIRDWEHYLRVDPKGSWADEARRRPVGLHRRPHQPPAIRAAIETTPLPTAGRPRPSSSVPGLNHPPDSAKRKMITVRVSEVVPTSRQRRTGKRNLVRFLRSQRQTKSS